MTVAKLADTLARPTDPQNSKDAAEGVAQGLSALRVAVLELVALRPISGSNANKRYQKWRSLRGWPKAAEDSPRKRLGELSAQGFVRVKRDVKGPNGKLEAEYEITQYGRDYLESTAS